MPERNRRGYAAFVQCGTCGDVATCPNCSISLTYHRTPERLVCHYCQHAEELHTKCPRCGAVRLRQRGLGTQQVERMLAERFPHARIARMDVDTTSGKWAHTEILDRVGAGEVDILLGTQMIAKGLDFPNGTRVGAYWGHNDKACCTEASFAHQPLQGPAHTGSQALRRGRQHQHRRAWPARALPHRRHRQVR